MAKKNIKPYGSSNNRNRTLNGSKKSSNVAIKQVNKQKDNKENSLSVTTKIRIDSNRINDAESLDTSFLEGRLDKKIRDNNKVKEKILKEKKQIIFDFEIIKWIFFSLAFLCVIILAIFYFKDSPLFKIDDSYTIDEKNNKSDNKTGSNQEKIVDSNYLFVGDFSINKLNFEELDYHYVKSADDKMTTKTLLENMKSYVYDFNPSDVFLQLGINDLDNDVSVDDIISNYKKIILEINNNRPYAKINIVSVNYINSDIEDFDSELLGDNVDNDLIKKLNGKLKQLAEGMNVAYIEFDELYNDNDKLDSRYTDNGIYINEAGNKIIEKIIKEYVE